MRQTDQIRTYHPQIIQIFAAAIVFYVLLLIAGTDKASGSTHVGLDKAIHSIGASSYTTSAVAPPDCIRLTHRLALFAEHWRPAAKEAARISGIPTNVILSVIHQESLGLVYIEHELGQKGLMGMRPEAARDVGLEASPDNPVEQVMAGVEFLALQMRRMDGDLYDGLRAFNAGVTGARLGLGHHYARMVFRRIDGHYGYEEARAALHPPDTH